MTAVLLASRFFDFSVVNSVSDLGSPRTPSARWTTKLFVDVQSIPPWKLPMSRMKVRMWFADVGKLAWFSALRMRVRMHREPGDVPWIVVTPLNRALISPYLIISQVRPLFVRSSYGFLKTLYASVLCHWPRFL